MHSSSRSMDRFLLGVSLGTLFLFGSILYRWPNLYLVILSKSEICSKTDAFLGLREFYKTAEAFKLASENCTLIRQDETGLRLWRTSLGDWWFPKTDEWYVYFTVAQYQVEAYSGVPIQDGDVVLDCGGYVGDFARFAISKGAAKVIVVEPSRQALECIRRNLRAEIQAGRVILRPEGLWDKEDRLYLAWEAENPAGNAISGSTLEPGEWVNVTSLDQMVAELGLDDVDVIKMDIEGAETKAILGARRTLNRFRPRLAIATEHTRDILQNNRVVIDAVQDVAPYYEVRCGFCRLSDRGFVPETLYFVDPS